jgi:uncharacterized protein DUF4124
MRKTIVLVLSLAFASAVFAQQYKWVDRDGKVQYGDVPPPGVKATPLKPPPPGVSSTPAPAAKDAKKDLSPEAAFRKRQLEGKDQEEKAAKERAEADSKRVNCENAQANLRMLQSGQRVSTTNAAGERVFIDDAQRAREIERTQRVVSDSCK